MSRESEITAFIAARLAEEEVTARSCLDEVGPCREGDPYEDGSGVADRDDYPSYPWGAQDRELAYMKRTQPRLRLREIDTFRKLVEAHVGYYGADDDEYLPVPTLSLLAAIWGDHEDYANAVKAADDA
jgi:hypothetical protein